MDIIEFIIYAAIYASIYTIFLLLIALKSPRLLLDFYPEEIQVQVIPHTSYESKRSTRYQNSLVVMCVLYPFVVSCYHSIKYDWKFWETFLFSWRLMLFLAIYSLVIIDWLIFCTITPQFIILPGSAGNKAYKNYNIPFWKFLRSLVTVTGMSLFIAFISHFKI